MARNRLKDMAVIASICMLRATCKLVAGCCARKSGPSARHSQARTEFGSLETSLGSPIEPATQNARQLPFARQTAERPNNTLSARCALPLVRKVPRGRDREADLAPITQRGLVLHSATVKDKAAGAAGTRQDERVLRFVLS